MASMTIRNLDEDVKQRLRLRAVEHGHSMEQEAREILCQAVNGAASHGDSDQGESTAAILHELLKPFRDVELDIMPRYGQREVHFD